jgi:transcriptional regulator with XRE-family HTH domain/ketosteroid isomerase-like protein
MNQPELGKKIVELRKAKGFTQEELVEKCKLNVRTLQRIESGEVVPRSYTIRIIFAALEYNFFDSKRMDSNGSIISKWPGQFFKYVIDLFNLKTHTMKKVTILSITTAVIAVTLFTVVSKTNAQSPSRVKHTIEESNKSFVEWFNNKQIDSLLTLYRADACILDKGCGTDFIRNHYTQEFYKYNLKGLSTVSVEFEADSVAIERGQFTIAFITGEELSGAYRTEWRYTNGKWLIKKDIPIDK